MYRNHSESSSYREAVLWHYKRLHNHRESCENRPLRFLGEVIKTTKEWRPICNCTLGRTCRLKILSGRNKPAVHCPDCAHSVRRQSRHGAMSERNSFKALVACRRVHSLAVLSKAARSRSISIAMAGKQGSLLVGSLSKFQ